ncbi:hypothetical protein RGQ29_023862 [Quercus rubra]|uniref:Rhodanese domain-containing protein n=1 Tax=Quercus rubra TaxID=3512 RepID=A0AAN7F6I5_QUERU|nr:hypothetical protein RGQ29_023862 [Quercus rubra]
MLCLEQQNQTQNLLPVKRSSSDMNESDHEDGVQQSPSYSSPKCMKPSGYQLQVFEVAKKRNTIAVLETGAGKTMVPVMLIKAIGEAIKSNGHKKLIVFLAPIVHLVNQVNNAGVNGAITKEELWKVDFGEELVTLSSDPLLKSPEISNAGRHLSAAEFHSTLQGTGPLLEKDSPTCNEDLVLLDARNLYETRIGKFHAPNVETLDPGIRQYSDLPSWIDDKSEQLKGKRVLMYCTGGIRCEMASAYIRSKGAGFENVFQLFGGIQRYLEQFPDGGFFKGKNFVFDHRGDEVYFKWGPSAE